MHNIVIWEGSDKTGKSSIIREFCDINPEYSSFKNKAEHRMFREEGAFLKATIFDQEYFTQFLEQTQEKQNLALCMDRGYPSEWVYSQVFDRQTDFTFLRKIDDIYAKLGTKIIICYSKVIRELDEIIPSKSFDEIMKMYLKFAKWTKCPVHFLDTTEINPRLHAETATKFLKSEEIRKEIASCRYCPKMVESNNQVLGENSHPVLPNGMGYDYLIVGIAPGRGGKQIKNGTKDRPFAYFSGGVLDDVLKELKIKKKSWITNVVKCCTPGDGVFLDKDVETCAWYLEKEIADLNPKKVILLGNQTKKWYEEYIRADKEVYTLWHPSYILRNTGNSWRDKEIFQVYLNRWRDVVCT